MFKNLLCVFLIVVNFACTNMNYVGKIRNSSTTVINSPICGSGTAIAHKGGFYYILTVAHLVPDGKFGDKIVIEQTELDKYGITMGIVKDTGILLKKSTDFNIDLAVIKTPDNIVHFNVVKLNSIIPPVGTEVFSCGSPEIIHNVFTNGITVDIL